MYKACLGTASGFYNSVSMSWSLFRCRGLPRRQRSSEAHTSERAQTMMELEASHRTGIRRQERLSASASTGSKSLAVRCRLCAPPAPCAPAPRPCSLHTAPCTLGPRRLECLLVLIWAPSTPCLPAMCLTWRARGGKTHRTAEALDCASTTSKSLAVRCRLCAPPSTLRPSPQTLLPAPCNLGPRRPECLLVLI